MANDISTKLSPSKLRSLTSKPCNYQGLWTPRRIHFLSDISSHSLNLCDAILENNLPRPKISLSKIISLSLDSLARLYLLACFGRSRQRWDRSRSPGAKAKKFTRIPEAPKKVWSKTIHAKSRLKNCDSQFWGAKNQTKKKHRMRIFTGLTQDFGGWGFCLCIFYPIKRLMPKSAHINKFCANPPSPKGWIPQMYVCMYMCFSFSDIFEAILWYKTFSDCLKDYFRGQEDGMFSQTFRAVRAWGSFKSHGPQCLDATVLIHAFDLSTGLWL